MRLQSRLRQALRDPYNSLVLQRGTAPRLAGPLRNTTFVAKDNFATVGEPTTCASSMLHSYASPFAATAVALLEQAGLAMAGKANMDEFGMGLSTTMSHHGATVNPRYADVRICGGSSGGSAAAVAAGMVDFSLGTDTGGSVRMPASYSGTVGFKPSYGRVSRYGVVAYAQGFDTVGVFAGSVKTAADVFAVLDRHDAKDITSMPQQVRNAVVEHQRLRTRKTLTIGVPAELLLAELQPDTMLQFRTVLQTLMQMGHAVHPVSVPSIAKLLAAYYTLAPAEAASNLARYDGVRYGHAAAAASGEAYIVRNRSDSLGSEVQRRLILGNYTLSSESGDNYFRATRVRKALVDELNDVFAFPNLVVRAPGAPDGCDVLLSPTTFGRAPKVAEFEQQTGENFLNMYLNDVLTVPASMAGLPAISVPCEDADYGVQVMGQLGDDAMVLEVASLIEQP